jgi:hypothetical protein
MTMTWHEQYGNEWVPALFADRVTQYRDMGVTASLSSSYSLKHCMLDDWFILKNHDNIFPLMKTGRQGSWDNISIQHMNY